MQRRGRRSDLDEKVDLGRTRWVHESGNVIGLFKRLLTACGLRIHA